MHPHHDHVLRHDLRTQDRKDYVSYSGIFLHAPKFQAVLRFFSRQVEHVGQYRVAVPIKHHIWYMVLDRLKMFEMFCIDRCLLLKDIFRLQG